MIPACSQRQGPRSSQRGWPPRAFVTVLGVLLLGILIPSCSTLTEHLSPSGGEPEIPASYHRTSDAPDIKGRGQVESWWLVFNDPTLTALIGRLRQNPDLAAATARTEQALALLGQSKANLWPRLLGDGAVRSRRDSVNELLFPTEQREYERYQLGASASWEIDLWGRVRGSVDRARWLAQSEEEQLRDLRLSLEANLARQYFAWRSAGAELAILEEAIRVRQDDLELEEARLALGTGVEVDVSRSKVALHTARASAESARRSRGKLEHAMALVAGISPAEFAAAQALPPSDGSNLGTPPKIPAGLPSALLIQRPDLRSAHQQLRAAALQVGIKKVDFFPKISLTGSGGVASLKSSNLFQPESTLFDIGPQIDLPIFQAGARSAAVEEARASWREAAANYRSLLLQAVGEVEDALLDVKSFARERTIQESAVKAARDTTEIARLRHERGLASYFEVVEAERDRLDARRAENALLGEQFAATVGLIQALGGTW